MSPKITRLAPIDTPLALASGWRVLQLGDPLALLRAGLGERLGVEQICFYRSGREALRVAFEALRASSGRDEVIVPAYTCYSVPAAAVAARMRVRLVDVTPRGAVDAESLAALPLGRAAAVVVCNLLGVPEPVEAVRDLAARAGVALVDDAAQAVGANLSGEPVGGRGEVGVLSFGRGKPLSGLGGGALAWSRSAEAPAEPEPGGAARLRAMSRLFAYAVARHPLVFRWLSAIPALGIGETVYDPEFRTGAIDGGALQLAAAALSELEVANATRAARARLLGEAIARDTVFEPLLAGPESSPAFPRLGVLAPDRKTRDGALRSLVHLGAARLYPEPLDRIGALSPHLCSGPPAANAARFSGRLLTLPTHDQLGERQVDEIVARLMELA